MTAYSEVESTINARAQTTVKKLFTEWAGEPDEFRPSVRFIQRPLLRSGQQGSPTCRACAPFECFQISIGPPCAGRIIVVACSVDTDDESECEGDGKA